MMLYCNCHATTFFKTIENFDSSALTYAFFRKQHPVGSFGFYGLNCVFQTFNKL